MTRPDAWAEASRCGDDSLGALLSRADAAFAQRLSQRTRAALGVTGMQGRLLFMLARRHEASVVELARAHGVDASSATRMLDRLEHRGLLARVRGHDDRRIVRVALTEAGRAHAAALPAIFRAVLGDLLAGCSPEDARHLVRLLARMRANRGGVHGTT
ncbi:MarR family transcriptional regulator [Burkholderia sp. FERM BP-3421]|jgi:DNA-binding MarR family transcriptional regulator|uniref:MarR family winged helix-turn-helix transcriptional regulator n=1 Tax=Burkholderia sp. FERM BP-3421 TaxID=1494466 RepID=UPI002360D76E|nr:MarR family transcriptional regulator [Burkholderia sp. FERM BP-3421]WDD95322.1 MarR family transcriptional regulator [Burkholderia sp. FERM BP-3421]